MRVCGSEGRRIGEGEGVRVRIRILELSSEVGNIVAH